MFIKKDNLHIYIFFFINYKVYIVCVLFHSFTLSTKVELFRVQSKLKARTPRTYKYGLTPDFQIYLDKIPMATPTYIPKLM